MVSWCVSVTSSVKRVQRVQLMQRSASRITFGPSWTRLGLCTLSNSKREPSGPYLYAWICSGHWPAWSQIGQSSGWLTSISSRFSAWASATSTASFCVWITMPSVMSSTQLGMSFGK